MHRYGSKEIVKMATADVRDVLDRLARGEITAEQADTELAESDADQTTQLQGPERSSADSEPTRQLHTEGSAADENGSPITVGGSLNGSGHLLVVGAAIQRPEIRGPASISIADDDSGGFTIRGDYADGTELSVPADADLQLEVNGEAVTLTNLQGTLQADFNVGDATIAARFDRGASIIDANASTVVVAPTEGSSVRVILRSACASTVDPAIRRTAAGEWTVGDGDASLTIQGNLGALILRDTQHE
jgi:hypothetical protein